MPAPVTLFLQAGCPFCHRTVIAKALNALTEWMKLLMSCQSAAIGGKEVLLYKQGN